MITQGYNPKDLIVRYRQKIVGKLNPNFLTQQDCWENIDQIKKWKKCSKTCI